MTIIRSQEEEDAFILEKRISTRLLEKYGTSFYVAIPLTFYHLGISRDAIHVLCYLVNIAQMEWRSNPTKYLAEDEYFTLSSNRLSFNLQMSSRIQVRVLNELISRGFISSAMRGFGKSRKRWLRVNTVAMDAAEIEVRKKLNLVYT